MTAAPPPLAFLDIGFSELLICGVVALVLFGGRLPEVMRTLGSAYRSFRRGVEDLSRTVSIPPKPTASVPYRPAPLPPPPPVPEGGIKPEPPPAPPPLSAPDAGGAPTPPAFGPAPAAPTPPEKPAEPGEPPPV